MKKKSHRPTKIGKYEIKRRIGRGSMGAVYEAYDHFVQRTVAIKVAHSQEDMDSVAKQKMREGFFSEVYTAGRMHHPSVVGVYDAGQEDDYNYIVMECNSINANSLPIIPLLSSSLWRRSRQVLRAGCLR